MKKLPYCGIGRPSVLPTICHKRAFLNQASQIGTFHQDQTVSVFILIVSEIATQKVRISVILKTFEMSDILVLFYENRLH